ncbi:hypothetical protein KAU15_00400, partial [candidate division WOR-3 bacterium]|nr:hypothetical protein [candidate division WOR-3 bacterium]
MRNREKTLNIIFLSIILLLPMLYYSNILFSGRMLFGTDWLSAGGYIKRAFILDSIKNGNGMPFWNPNVFAGIPTGEGFWGDIFYPVSNFLKLFFSLTTSWTLIFILHPILAGIGTYLFMKNKTKNQFISFFSAIIYMFTSVILSETYAGHDGRVIVTTLFPLLIYFLDKGVDYRRMLDFSLAGLIGGFMLLSGHIQSSYYAIVIGIFYVSFIHISRTYEHKLRNLTWIIALIIGFVFSFINRYFGFLIFSASILSIPWILDKKFRKETIWMYFYLLMFVIVTAVIATIQYLPLLKFLPETAREVERGYRYSVSWSMGLSEIIDMFFPGFTGVNVGKINSYWGENPFKLHLRYIGIIPMLLTIGVIVTRKKNEIVTFFTIIFFTGIIIALGGGTPIYRMFYNLFPYFDKFRAPDLAFFITSFAGCILAGYFFVSKVPKKTMTIIVATIVLIGIIIVFIPGLAEGICGSFIRGFEVQKDQIALKTNIMSLGIKNISGTVFFIIITALLAFLSIYYLDKKYINYVLIAITIITASDLLIRN